METQHGRHHVTAGMRLFFYGDVMYKLRILSLGAGVQSTTLYLMAERGEIEPFHCAIFADTGWESEATYAHLEWLKQVGKTPIITVQSDKGSIFEWSLEAQLRGSSIFSVLPFHTSNNGNKGMLHRQCTSHFKLDPIRKQTRKLLGLVPRQRAPKGAVEQVIGISMDEARRMKLSRENMTRLSYPLVDMGMHRYHCEAWLAQNYAGLVVPKSSCVGCPFHRNAEWRKVRDNPVAWKQAVELDNTMREAGITDSRLSGFLYLHRSCKPLEEVDLSTPEERGQQVFDFAKDEKLNLFVNNISIHVPEVLPLG